jgi:alpha-aminoadipate carrier protein LysW
MKTVTTEAECPECYGAVKLVDVMQSEIVQCPECGTEHEVVEIAPVKLEPAPQEEEDWGE